MGRTGSPDSFFYASCVLPPLHRVSLPSIGRKWFYTEIQTLFFADLKGLENLLDLSEGFLHFHCFDLILFFFSRFANIHMGLRHPIGFIWQKPRFCKGTRRIIKTIAAFRINTGTKNPQHSGGFPLVISKKKHYRVILLGAVLFV